MDKIYFLHNGTEQQGPFDINELKAKGVTLDTHIWYEGIQDWVAAGNIDALKSLFSSSAPPPFKKQGGNQYPLEKSKVTITFLRVIMIIAFIIIAWIIIGVLISNYRHSHGSDNGSGSSYREKVMTVEEIEKSDPVKFLATSGNYRETFFGDNFKIEGEIKNNATVANYKDVVIEVIFYSETDTELKRERYTVYKFCTAHSTQTFELKVGRPKVCKKIGLAAVGATAY